METKTPVKDSLFDYQEPEDSLRNYFKLKSFAPYKDIPINKMAFNARIKYALKSNGYETLAELLKVSLKNLKTLKGFERSSINNVLATLQNFFETRRLKIPMEALRLANKALDKPLRYAAYNHDPQIDLIITALREFAVLATKRKFVREKIRKQLLNLPDEFKRKKTNLLLRACGLEQTEFFARVSDDLALNELPEYLAKVAFDYNPDELINFVSSLDFDVRTCAKKIATIPLSNEREQDIIVHRAEGDTLKIIGDYFGITRERVRQMENKVIMEFYRNCLDDLKKLVYFLHALTDGKITMTIQDVEPFIDVNDAKIIWFLAEKVNFRSDILHFDEELKAFVCNDGARLNERELIKHFPSLMEEETFEAMIKDFAREKNCSVSLLKTKLSNIYKRAGKMFYRGRLTLFIEYDYILKEHFPNGYKIASKNDYSRFLRLLKEIFNDNTPFNQRSLEANVVRVGVLCDRGRYIHPDFLHIPEEIVEHVRNFIDSSDRTAIFYKEIFESLKDVLAGTQITNHYFLQGIIKLHGMPYILRKDYLTKTDEINMADEFNNFVIEHGVVSFKEIKEHFVSFETINVDFLLERCPEIIRIGDGLFMHTSLLDLKEEDFQPIREFIQQNCSQPVNSRLLFNLFHEQFPEFFTRNKINDHDKLFGILRYMFQDEFKFWRPYISVEKLPKISATRILLRALADKDKIDFEEFNRLCAEHGLSYLNKMYLMERLQPDFIRVDEVTLQRPESIGLTDEIISAVVKAIQALVKSNGGWQSANAFNNYEGFPQLSIPWNGFLLEKVVALSKVPLRILKIPTRLATGSPVFFLSEEFPENDFKPALLKILVDVHKKKPFRSEEEILTWLREQGLCYKNLPRFISTKASEILSQ